MITSEPGQKGKDEFFTIYNSIIYHRRTLERETRYMLHYVISIYWTTAAAAAAKSLQLRLTLCDRIDGSPPGSSIPGILACVKYLIAS